MKAFEVTLITAKARAYRTIIARTSMEAARIGLRMMPDTDGAMGIICKLKVAA